MRYVDWVERVLRETVEAFDAGDGYWTDDRAIAERLGLDYNEHAAVLFDVLADLERLSLIETNGGHVSVGQEARKIRYGSLRTSWPTIAKIWLEPRQEAFLQKLCELSEQRHVEWAELNLIDGDEVLIQLGESPEPGSCNPLINQLSALGLVDGSHRTFGSFKVSPTYAGVVRGTEKVATDGQALVGNLLEDWETTNVEFKSELHLGTKDEKAEFVRDVLALANTQVTGDRSLVTGFDPKTHDFTTPADLRVTQDTIENILNEFTKPSVAVLYKAFEWIDGSGDVGLLEVVRDRTKVPYRVARDLAGERKRIEADDVFVRHNSHVAKATAKEIADLEEEAARARAV